MLGVGMSVDGFVFKRIFPKPLVLARRHQSHVICELSDAKKFAECHVYGPAIALQLPKGRNAIVEP